MSYDTWCGAEQRRFTSEGLQDDFREEGVPEYAFEGSVRVCTNLLCTLYYSKELLEFFSHNYGYIAIKTNMLFI